MILKAPPLGWFLAGRGDRNDRPTQSDLRLWVNGAEIGPPHQAHDDIRQGKTSGFSHWGGYVVFSLPAGVENGPDAEAVLRYGLYPPAWAAPLLAVAAVLAGFVGYRRPVKTAIVRGANSPAARWLPAAPYLVLRGLIYAAAAAAVLYAAASVAALVSGWAMPTTAPIRWSRLARAAAGSERSGIYFLVALAAVGALATWLSPRIANGRSLIERQESAAAASLNRWLWLVLPVALVFAISAMWAGVVHTKQVDNIAGLIPYFDAEKYLAGTYDQAHPGVWNAFGQRRPLASAFRSLLLLAGGFSAGWMLLLQAALLGATLTFATVAVVRWRGVWAGTAFLALSWLLARDWLPTDLTEPLALCCVFFCVPFLIGALRTGSAACALVAFGSMTVALMLRMGSMFTIPALLLWVVWRFGHRRERRQRLRVAALAVAALAAIGGANYGLNAMYGSTLGDVGGNFSYVACGFSVGGDWTACPRRLGWSGLPASDREAEAVLYAYAWRNFKQDPSRAFEALAKSGAQFLQRLPDILWRGYSMAPEPRWLPRPWLSLMALAGLAAVLARRRKAGELGFWLCIWGSTLLSAPFVFINDGARTLIVSYVPLLLFFALGFSDPFARKVPYPADPRRFAYRGLLVIAAAGALFVLAPAAAERLFPRLWPSIPVAHEDADERIVFGGRLLSGFLVVADDHPIRPDTPTLHVSELAAAIGAGGTESYQSLLHPTAPPLPFGFAFAPRADGNVNSNDNIYIVPPEVMTRHDVTAWRFRIAPWQQRPGVEPFWVNVANATPAARESQPPP
ncbi:MAG TPA: hypothetical protein VFA12_05290 [Stellaceae bacterium]|nr:hypothetical protein [Stellaceae bacterium]